MLALALANALFFAWTAGWLGTPPAVADRDPARLARQLRPEAVRVLAARQTSVAEALPVADAQANEGACLEAGPFAPAELAAAERLLAAMLGAGAWSRHLPAGAGWAVVSGPHADAGALARERARIEGAGLAARPLADVPGAAPGLLLGRHDTPQAAVAARAAAARRGVRAARVVAVGDVASLWLRVEGDEATLRGLLAPIAAPVGGVALGQRFAACAADAPR